MQLLKKNIYPLLLVLIVGIIAFLNYTPHTFLSGWDTLHPEFDFGLNFQRLFTTGVWRVEQGVGTVSGHAHMADIPRVILLWILHFILPIDMLKYFYLFLCLLLGPLGIFFLIKGLLKNQLTAFVSALFYLLNLGTVQQFYLPFEMFPTQYAALPWIMLFTVRFLRNKEMGGAGGGPPQRARVSETEHWGEETRDRTHFGKTLIWFCVVTLLATPQAYAPQLWFAFFGVYVLFLIAYVILAKTAGGAGGGPPQRARVSETEHWGEETRDRTRRALILVALTLAINSFWLLPNLYFITTSSKVPIESKQNRLFSQEYRLRNRENGYLSDVSQLKGFYLNWNIFDFQKQKSAFAMEPWRNHFKGIETDLIGYCLFAIVILGLITAFIDKNKIFISFSPFFFVPFVLLTNSVFPFNKFFDFLLKFSIFDEGLRFVYSKFSLLLMFSYILYFAYALNRVAKSKLIYAALILGLFIYAYPVFQGHLISEKVKVKIPNKYFRLWNYMKTQENGIVLSLPLYNLAGWTYYDWGYQGSGFLWFGLKQALFDRDSDRWSIANEQAYREFNYALYSQKVELFSKNLDKFNVQYLLLDQSVTSPELKNTKQILYTRETQTLLSRLENTNKITKIKQFDDIYVYKITDSRKLKEIKKITNKVAPAYRWSFYDTAYLRFGDYISSDGGYFMPFRDLIDPTDRLKKEFLNLNTVSRYTDARIALKLQLPKTNFNADDGVSLNLESLSHKQGYVITLRSRNIGGLPLRICIKNLYSQLCSLYDQLSPSKSTIDDYFILPPTDQGIGYRLLIDNISYGNYNSHNELQAVTIRSFPYNFLSSVLSQTNKQATPLDVLILNQAYSPSWIAFANGKKLNHVVVNNWANGWSLNETGTEDPVTIIFWPQYLEFLGFAWIIAVFAWIIVRFPTR